MLRISLTTEFSWKWTECINGGQITQCCSFIPQHQWNFRKHVMFSHFWQSSISPLLSVIYDPAPHDCSHCPCVTCCGARMDRSPSCCGFGPLSPADKSPRSQRSCMSGPPLPNSRILACKNHSLWPTWPPLLCCSHRLYSWSFTRLIGNNRRQSLLELLPSYDASWDETQTAVTETSELIKGEFDHFHALMCCWLSALGWRTFLSHCGFWNPHTGDFWLLCWNWDKTSRVNHFSI